ncbi:MAG: hypothetical protein AB9866_21425 [Syntrophobacteraceae bacterium]
MLDWADYERLPKRDTWRLITAKGKSLVVNYFEKKKVRTLVRQLFDFHPQGQRVVFLNGNRLDFRRANMSFPIKNSGFCREKDMAAFRDRTKTSGELRAGKCILISSKAFSRPAGCLACDLYDECLNVICKKTEWPNWAVKERLSA